jgi:hypothetical protein
MIIPEAYQSGHPMGSSKFLTTANSANKTTNLIYIEIPKNASCWARHHFPSQKNYNYYDHGIDVQQDCVLVILREPLDRWVSAMAQILVGSPPNSAYHIDNICWDWTTSHVYQDSHTQPQHDFFANIPMETIVWFKCDQSLKDNFVNFLKEHNVNVNLLSQNQDVDNIFNVTAKIPEKIIDDEFKSPPRQQIVDKILLKLDQHPEYVDRIKQLYAKDYAFFNTVQYYGTR